jgi:hypothetical protein
MAEQDSVKRKHKPIMVQPTAETIPTDTTGAILGGDLQAHIGRQLRAVYEEVASEDVPDRFLKLLEELERNETKKS